VSRPALGPTQPPIKWVTRALSLGVRRPGCGADHSPPFSADAKNAWGLYLHSPNTPSWRGAQLKHSDNFTFTECDLKVLMYGEKIRKWQVAIVDYFVVLPLHFLRRKKKSRNTEYEKSEPKTMLGNM
jgi:hypothetical protein